MALHLVKLCVGAESVEDMQRWSAARLDAMRKSGGEVQLFHTTRMVPKAIDELLDGGSLYWVIKGVIQLRQSLVDIRPFKDGEGIRRCHLMLGNDLVLTQPQPRRPFQGWRYLKAEDAPSDLTRGDATVPAELRNELAELGLL